MANLGTLIADLGLNTARFEAGLNKATAGLSTFQRRMAASFRSLKHQAGQLKTAIAAVIGGLAVKKIVDEFTQAEQAAFQLQARLRSTGDVVGFTADQLKGMARALQQVTVFGDDAIIEMQGLLLSFTNIRGQQFVDAQKAILDMATAMGVDLKSAVTQLGKALNDPKEQLSSLSRIGITFSESQKKLIREMVDTNRAAEAQAIILAELETKFGGSAQAAAKGLGGAIKQLQNAFSDLLETIGRVVSNDGESGLIQWITEAIKWLDRWISRLPNLFVVLFGEIDKSILGIKYIWNNFTEFMSSKWDDTIAMIKSAMASFLDVAGNALAKIPGLDDAATHAKGFAQYLREQAEAAEPLEKRLAKINDEYLRQLRIIEGAVQMSVDAGIAEEERMAALEKTTGKDARAKAVKGIVPNNDELQKDLDRLRASLLDKETIEVEAWFNRQAILDSAMSAGILNQDTHKRLTENLEKLHQDRLTQIAIDGASERQKFMALSARQQTQTVLGEMLSLTNGVSQSNKTLFRINQAAGIANATINAYVGASKSIKTYPWPLAGVMAGLHLAAGFAIVRAISSQSFTGGGGVSPSIGGATGASTTVATIPSDGARALDIGSGDQSIHVTVNLNDDALIDSMQKASRHGRLVIDAEAA